jgi:hypothetical protein
MSGNARPVLVRFDRDLGEFQAQCRDCAKAERQSYFPLTLDFWLPSQGVQRCKACINTKRRIARRAAMDAKEKQRRYYAAHREHRLEWVRAYRERRRDEINALRRAAYARRKAGGNG